jgi:hypothetical protein
MGPGVIANTPVVRKGKGEEGNARSEVTYFEQERNSWTAFGAMRGKVST